MSASYKAHKNTKTTTVKTWIMTAMDFTKLFLKSRAKDFYLTALVAISNVPGLLAHVPGKHMLLYMYIQRFGFSFPVFPQITRP
jgi:hypothetical protein